MFMWLKCNEGGLYRLCEVNVKLLVFIIFYYICVICWIVDFVFRYLMISRNMFIVRY